MLQILCLIFTANIDFKCVNRRAKKTLRKKRKPKSIYEIYEPSELERAGFTDEDNRIRATDIPERMQLRTVPVTSAGDEELDEEAEWIFEVAFNKKKDKHGDPIAPSQQSKPQAEISAPNPTCK